MTEYVIAYATDSTLEVRNHAIVEGIDVRLSASLHARLSRRGVAYVYKHSPRGYMNRGQLVAIATQKEWYPS